MSTNAWTRARLATEEEAARATAMAEEVIRNAKEEIALKLATVSTAALVQMIEHNAMEEILWVVVDSTLAARKAPRYGQ